MGVLEGSDGEEGGTHEPVEVLVECDELVFAEPDGEHGVHHLPCDVEEALRTRRRALDFQTLEEEAVLQIFQTQHGL